MSLKAIIAWGLCLAGFIAVLCCFPSIWPLAGVDVGQPKSGYIERAREVLTERDIDHQGYVPFVSLAVRDEVLDTLQREKGLEETKRLTGEANGLVRYYVHFKKAGTPKTLTVVMHPDGRLIGVSQAQDPDLDKGGLSAEAFRDLAHQQIEQTFHIDSEQLTVVQSDSSTRDGVVHHRLDLQRSFEGSPSLNEKFAVATGGDTITAIGRRIAHTEAATRESKRLRGPEQGMSQFGYLCMGLGLVAAYILFLFQLRGGEIELIPALKVAAVMFAMVFGSAMLDANTRYDAWDPVWPRFNAWVKLISTQMLLAMWAFVFGWALLAGGTRAPGGGLEKTASFWEYTRFRWHLPEVGMASLRGGALGFFCGGVVILMVLGFEHLLGGEVGLQPRAFFLSMLDRQIPALAIVLFFFPIAVCEEAGYRLFAAMWIRKLTKSKWLAILIPAIIFGLIHTSLGFLPPENPWWGRALVMTVVGIIWGWAFFRFDFLTVVICHFMADVVIFSWPLLVSEYAPSKVMAAIGISTALWPAGIWLASRFRNRPAPIER